jgi:multisubunit Na+/H+ antiporter MnhC subunit
MFFLGSTASLILFVSGIVLIVKNNSVGMGISLIVAGILLFVLMMFSYKRSTLSSTLSFIPDCISDGISDCEMPDCTPDCD